MNKPDSRSVELQYQRGHVCVYVCVWLCVGVCGWVFAFCFTHYLRYVTTHLWICSRYDRHAPEDGPTLSQSISRV